MVNTIITTCDPADNNKHMYVGFLTRGNNPNDFASALLFY